MVKPWRRRREAVLVALLMAGVAVAAKAQRPASDPRPAPEPAMMRSTSARVSTAPATPAGNLAPAQSVVAKTCVGCHSDRARAGNLSLQAFDINTAAEHREITEKMIRKLRAGLMPPAGARRPDESVLDGLAEALEAQADARGDAPSPG